jgi:hypothetical protein
MRQPVFSYAVANKNHSFTHIDEDLGAINTYIHAYMYTYIHTWGHEDKINALGCACSSIKEIDWDDFPIAFSSFMIIATMPFT